MGATRLRMMVPQAATGTASSLSRLLDSGFPDLRAGADTKARRAGSARPTTERRAGALRRQVRCRTRPDASTLCTTSGSQGPTLLLVVALWQIEAQVEATKLVTQKKRRPGTGTVRGAAAFNKFSISRATGSVRVHQTRRKLGGPTRGRDHSGMHRSTTTLPASRTLRARGSRASTRDCCSSASRPLYIRRAVHAAGQRSRLHLSPARPTPESESRVIPTNQAGRTNHLHTSQSSSSKTRVAFVSPALSARPSVARASASYVPC